VPIASLVAYVGPAIHREGSTVTAEATPTSPSWWRSAVGYEVYVRSFADHDGDGMGDLRGVRDRLEHLAWLGVDAVWITPFYPSPGFDGGYDVMDYTAVDPRHGSLADFDDLVNEAHDLGLRVIIDVVPNHTSHLHPWFIDASSGRDSALRDFYIWRDPAADGGPPNNWVSHFGGPAWTLDEASGQYYCHLFLPEQPDLNWANAELRARFDEVLRFWCDRGIDGFRVDVAHALVKHPDFPDNPRTRLPGPEASVSDVFASFDHRYDLDQDDNVELHRRWRRVVEQYGAILIGEVGVPDPGRLARYTRDGDGVTCVFFLEPAGMPWDPGRLVDTVRDAHELEPDRVAWTVDSHDASRSATRFGGGWRGASRSLAATTLLFGLGGMPFLYQGQELGLEDGLIAPGDLDDPIATRNQGSPGRDGARTAMPWDPGPGNGFSTGTPWLPAGHRRPEETVSVQAETAGSWLHRHRELISVRGSLDDLWDAPARWLPTGEPEVAAVLRGTAMVLANLSARRTTIGLPDASWRVAYSSSDDDVELEGSAVSVPAETSLILTTRAAPGEAEGRRRR
jgi:alpha-glucosidase